MVLPTHTDEWMLEGASKSDFLLRLNRSVPIPPMGAEDVLLEVKAVSLNYRDIAIARGLYPLPVSYPLSPLSDASAVVLAVGAAVTSLNVGDAVIVLPAPLFVSGHLTAATHATCGDGALPGVLHRHVVLPAAWLARFPRYLTFEEASTIGGAGVSAWNVLFGSPSSAVGPGSKVLVQGTGAVSLFAAAFAVHAGANVVATTSDTTAASAKSRQLVSLGVQTVLNYREDPAWGQTARGLTPDGEGVDLVVDVGGPGTLGQSLEAVRYGGEVAVVGFLDASGKNPGPTIMDVLPRAVTVRGILIGSHAQYYAMVEKMEKWQLHPVIDKRVFDFTEVKAAYEYLWQQKHIGKVVIQCNEV